MRGCHPNIIHPNNRASEQRGIRCAETTMQCATSDGQMTCCSVGQMIDDRMKTLGKRCGAVICHFPSEQPSNRTTEHPIGPEGGHWMARTVGRMAVCSVVPMNDDPMISALLKDWALLWAGRVFIGHHTTGQPSIRTTEHRIVPEVKHRVTTTVGRMAVCPVDPMNDDPMVSALPRDRALLWARRVRCGAVICHHPSEQPSIRTTEHRIVPEVCLCMAKTVGRMAVCPVVPMGEDATPFAGRVQPLRRGRGLLPQRLSGPHACQAA